MVVVLALGQSKVLQLEPEQLPVGERACWREGDILEGCTTRAREKYAMENFDNDTASQACCRIRIWARRSWGTSICSRFLLPFMLQILHCPVAVALTPCDRIDTFVATEKHVVFTIFQGHAGVVSGSTPS